MLRFQLKISNQTDFTAHGTTIFRHRPWAPLKLPHRGLSSVRLRIRSYNIYSLPLEGKSNKNRNFAPEFSRRDA